MSSLSQFFSSGGKGSTFRQFVSTGSVTLPSSTTFVAAGVIGGGGGGRVCYCRATSCYYNYSAGGGGFAWSEYSTSCGNNFAVCAVVGAGGAKCDSFNNCHASAGGTSALIGLSGGTICATGGGISPDVVNCVGAPGGIGYGGQINTCGGGGATAFSSDSYYIATGGGGGAGGMLGNGGQGGKGFAGSYGSCSGGSGGSGSGGGSGGVYAGNCPAATAGPGGNERNGLHGVPGIVYGCSATPPSVNYPPFFVKCGYSQAKSMLSMAGPGSGQVTGAMPGGGGGFMGGGAAYTDAAMGGGGGGSGGNGGQGLVVIEYWE